MDEELRLAFKVASIILAERPALPTEETIKQVADRVIHGLFPALKPRADELVRELEPKYIVGPYQRTSTNEDVAYLRLLGYVEAGQLLIGVMSAGVSYLNRKGNNGPLAFLPFVTLELDLNAGCPNELISEIETHSAAFIAEHGECLSARDAVNS